MTQNSVPGEDKEEENNQKKELQVLNNADIVQQSVSKTIKGKSKGKGLPTWGKPQEMCEIKF